MAARPGLANAIAANRAPTIQRKGYFDMFHIGQRVVCIDDRFPGENGVFDPTFAERCPNLPVRDLIYTVRDFVVPYAGYPCLKKSSTRHVLILRVRSSPHFSLRTFDL
jgi:hypothetical protein